MSLDFLEPNDKTIPKELLCILNVAVKQADTQGNRKKQEEV